MRKFIIAALSALGLVVGAGAANAGNAGITWYNTRTCYPVSGSGAKLVVSNYNYGSGQQYHVHAYTSTYPVLVTNRYLYFDGAAQGSLEFYKTFSSPTSIHTTKWVTNPTGAYCSITL